MEMIQFDYHIFQGVWNHQLVIGDEISATFLGVDYSY